VASIAGASVCGGMTIAASPECTPGKLDVLEHCRPMNGRFAVADTVHVELDRVLEKFCR